MGKEIDLYRRWKKAKQQLEEIFQSPEHTIVVHYSCESFYDRGDNPNSPRVTSIALRNLDSGQTKSYSIHIFAEQQGLLKSIDNHYDQLEKMMLEAFFQEARTKQHCKWLHWNMRDANFGFEALKNRLLALGGSPYEIDERNRFDLSRMLISIYGVGYVGHPRIEKLMELNHVAAKDFLTGQQEADAFDAKQFVRLHQSTLRKVDVFANIAGRANNNTLITLGTWWEKNGRSVKACIEFLKEHWIISLLGLLLSITGIIFKFTNLLG
ncbi:hypothetical protein [Methylophilus aquaticus]|uniref:Uncharacterized protein n=1 Tax=Methylophilus aquaticus TaxID=1971610 RepID=A0ABT9JWW2_9PROT|nr:hypothetical protein [Methylophilus aquaticus]MDP8568616.1 hypothetical protein [Methylophilus aquaticus]